jgi:hypothetical protein
VGSLLLFQKNQKMAAAAAKIFSKNCGPGRRPGPAGPAKPALFMSFPCTNLVQAIDIKRKGRKLTTVGERSQDGLAPNQNAHVFRSGGLWQRIPLPRKKLWVGSPYGPYREFSGKLRLWRPLWRRNNFPLAGKLVYELWVVEAGSNRSK